MSMYLVLSLLLRDIYAFGGAGVVTLKHKIHSKLHNKCETCVMVGYANHHADDVYEMWNPTTSELFTTRDVCWLNRMFYTSVIFPTTGAVVIKAGESAKTTDKDDDDEDSDKEDALTDKFWLPSQDEQLPSNVNQSSEPSNSIMGNNNGEVGSNESSINSPSGISQI